MKNFLWIPLAVLAGLALGSWGPRTELRDANDRISLLEQQLTVATAPSDRGMTGVTDMLRIPRDSRQERRTDPPPVDEEPDEPAAAHTQRDIPGEEPQPESRRRGLEERIEDAVELWRVRSSIARNTFIANAGLKEKDVIAFDVVIKAMNIRMESVLHDWAERIEEGTPLDPETGVRLINDITSVLTLTYDELDRKLPGTDRREHELALRDFIDPAVAMPLVRIEDRLRTGDINMR